MISAERLSTGALAVPLWHPGRSAGRIVGGGNAPTGALMLRVNG